VKHTPGEWVIGTDPRNTSPEDGPYDVNSLSHGHIADVECDGIDEWAENARLIAAAPDLLAACEAVAKWLKPLEADAPDSLTAHRKLLTDAIAKAVASR
jgi:hypothetical protein